MSLYDAYTDEADFRERFIKPLLNRMGFFAIAETHGQHEFGKDFVFAELTPFGFVRHYAAQVKHEKAIRQSQGRMLGNLLEQIKQAFAVPFKISDSPREKYVSAVYIFNSGKITDGAQEYILRSLEKESFGENVHFFDGDRLDVLNRQVAYQLDQNVRDRLVGLENQLLLNIQIWTAIQKQAKERGFSEARGALLSAIETFLTYPVCPDSISYEDILFLWQQARIIDAVRTRYLNMPNQNEKAKQGDIDIAVRLTDQTITLAHKVIGDIHRTYSSLRPL